MRCAFLAFLLGCVCALGACQSNVVEPAPAQAPQVSLPPPSAPAEVAEPELSPREHIEKAIALLQKGDADIARRHLEEAKRMRPDSAAATSLLEQIDADPKRYLGSESFPYTVEKGDTLSVIADEFLQDWLKFPILARYNNIPDPSRIAPGQVLRIPYQGPQSESSNVTATSTGLITKPVSAAKTQQELADSVDTAKATNEALEADPPAAGERTPEELIEVLEEEALANEIRAGQDEEGAYTAPPSSDLER